MRTKALLLAVAVGIAFSAAPALAHDAASANASGSCNEHSDSASADSHGDVDAPDGESAANALVALVLGDSPGDCSGGGHLGAQASAGDESVGFCTDGQVLYTGGNDEVEGCTAETPFFP